MGETDSEFFFALITRRIDEHGGDVGAGIAAAAREIAAEIAMYSLNMVLATPDEVWALRYPETNELWILERSIGGLDPGSASRSAAPGDHARQSRELVGPAGDRDRLRAHGLEPRLAAARVRRARPRRSRAARHLHDRSPVPPAHMIDLSKMTTREAIAQGEAPAVGEPG